MIINQTCHELHSVVMRAIALGLDLDETFFDDKINDQFHNLRLLSYPPIKTSQLKEDGQARRISEHSGESPFLSVATGRNKHSHVLRRLWLSHPRFSR
jgi:isopenicillin N synthase-like dioxygenase